MFFLNSTLLTKSPCVAVVSVSFKHERRARELGKKEQKSRSGGGGGGGGGGAGRKGNAIPRSSRFRFF